LSPILFRRYKKTVGRPVGLADTLFGRMVYWKQASSSCNIFKGYMGGLSPRSKNMQPVTCTHIHSDP